MKPDAEDRSTFRGLEGEEAAGPSEQLLDLLTAYDEALAAGHSPGPDLSADTTPDLSGRLEKAQACLRRLEEDRLRTIGLPEGSLAAAGPALAFDARGAFTQLGRFQVLRELGRGGGGIVYLAFDPLLRREVALKVPRPEALGTTELRRRFLREARAVAGLDHPNVVAVHEVGEIGPFCYLVSTYCPGQSLAAWLKNQPAPVPPRDAAQLVATLAHAVHYVHGRGILHRDLKPSNILLTEDRDQGTEDRGWKTEDRKNGCTGASALSSTPKITDFGLARWAEGEGGETKTGTVIGTPRYMAPEQAEGRTQDIGPAADVYALGVILYEVLTGRPPFVADTELGTLRLVLAEEPLPPRRLRPDMPPDLEAVCLKCLEKESEQRYASAALLAEDLRHFLAGEPTRVRPAGPLGRARKWARRRPALAAMTGISALALLGLLLGTGWYAVEADRHNRELKKVNRDLVDTAAREQEQRTLAEERALSVRRLHYVSQFRLMHQLREQGQVSEVLRWLDAQRPEPGQEDLRGFEWHYLKASCLPLRAVWFGHRDIIYAVAVSPDGKTVATGSGDRTIKLWDLATGQVRATWRGHTDWVECLDFSADGRTLVSASMRGREIKVWDVESATPRPLVAFPALNPVDVKIAPDGKTLAIAVEGANRLLLYDLVTGGQRFLGAERDYFSVAFAPDSNTVAASWGEGTVQLWDVRTGKKVLSLSGHRGKVLSIAFSPDGRKLATRANDQSAKVWDFSTGKVLATFPGHPGMICSVAFSPDGRVLAMTNRGKGTGPRSPSHAQLWDVASGKELADFKNQLGKVRSLAFTRDGQIVVGCTDQTVKLLAFEHGPSRRELLGHAPKEVWSLAFAPDGKTLVSAGDDHRVRLWDVTTGEPSAVLAGHDALVTAVAYSPDGKTLASGSFDETVKLWDAATSRPRATLPAGKTRVRCLAFSAHAPLLAVGNQDNTVRLWNLSTGEELTTLAGHEKSVRAVAFTPDGKTLVTAGEDKTIVLWDTATWQQRQRLEDTQQVWCLALAQDGKTMASGHDDGSVRIWDLDTGRVRNTLEGHANGVHGVAFAPDGKTFATAGEDKTVKLWQTATEEELFTLKGHETRVNAVAFSPDGRTLASASHDGAVKLWFATAKESDAIPSDRR